VSALLQGETWSICEDFVICPECDDTVMTEGLCKDCRNTMLSKHNCTDCACESWIQPCESCDNHINQRNHYK